MKDKGKSIKAAIIKSEIDEKYYGVVKDNGLFYIELEYDITSNSEIVYRTSISNKGILNGYTN